jgi:predicted ATPase
MCRAQCRNHTDSVLPPAPRIELNHFVGRAADEQELKSLVLGARILTLTGPAGVGKSRLALRVAQAVRTSFADGVALVDLGRVVDADGLAQVLFEALDVAAADDWSLLARQVEGLDLLLVLDNCEQVLGACAELARALAQCPRLRLLLTSRAALRIPGEHVWPLAPLPLPSADDRYELIAASEAVALFVMRTQEVDAGFELTHANARLVASVCRRLDGLPRALELAAPRLSLLSIAQLESELAESLHVLDAGTAARDKHQTLTAGMDRSLLLVPEPSRRLFRRLAVLAGPWTLADARRVCSDEELSAPDVLPLLAELVDAALVQARPGTGSTQFSLLETTRRYAAELLDASGEEDRMRQRHAAWCVGVSAQLVSDSPCSSRLGAVKGERADLVEALGWVLAREAIDFDAALALANALHHAWCANDHSSEGLARLERILASDEGDPCARATAWCRAATHARRQGALVKALDYTRRAQNAAVMSGDASQRPLILETTADIHLDRGDLAAAWAVLNELRAVAPQSTFCCTARATARMAAICLERGEVDDAEALASASLGALEDPACESVRAGLLQVAGRVALARGDLRRATWSLTRSFEAARESGDSYAMLESLLTQIELAVARGQSGPAAHLARQALTLAETVDGILARVRVLESCASALGRPQGVPLARAASARREQLGLGRWPSDDARLGKLAGAVRTHESLPVADALDLARQLLAGDESTYDTEGFASQLTRREREVAQLVGSGQSTREVAEELVISEGTVRAHVEHIRTKLGLTSRAEIGPLLGLRRN